MHHRAPRSSAQAPENTLAAIRVALQAGMGFEIDLQRLADGTVVLLHDSYRGAPPLSGRGTLHFSAAPCGGG